MTEQTKDAIREMVAGTSADNLERVANLSEEAVALELGEWSAHKVYHLTNQVANYNSMIAEMNEKIALLTPFVNPNTQVEGII
jgi:hypothetical protein